MGSYNISDYLRQRITGILDSDDPSSLKVTFERDQRRGSCNARVAELNSKMSKSFGVNKISADGINRVNTSNYSNTVLSPRMAQVSVNDTLFQVSNNQIGKSPTNKASDADATLSTAKNEHPIVFPYVIMKPILTGELLFSENTFRSVLPGSESNLKTALDFTPVSTVKLPQTGSPQTVTSPENRSNYKVDSPSTQSYPLKRFVIKMEENIKSASENRETAQFKEQLNKVENKTDAQISSFSRTKDNMNEVSASMNSGGNFRLAKPDMVDRSTQTNNQNCKSVAVQVNQIPAETVLRSNAGTPRNMQELRTVRKTAEHTAIKSPKSNRDHSPPMNSQTQITIKPLNLESVHSSDTHRKNSSDNILLTGYPGDTPQEQLTDRSQKDSQRKSSHRGSLLEPGTLYYEYQTLQGPSSNKKEGGRSIALLDSPMKKSVLKNATTERSPSNSKSPKKPQIMYDPSKVITAKVSTFRTPRSQKDKESNQGLTSRSRSRDVAVMEPESPELGERDLLSSPEARSSHQGAQKNNLSQGVKTVQHSPVTKERIPLGQKKPPTGNLIDLKEVKKTGDSSQRSIASNPNNNTLSGQIPANHKSSTFSPNSQDQSSPKNSRVVEKHPPTAVGPISSDKARKVGRSKMLYDFDLLNNDDINNLDSFGLSASNLFTQQGNRTPDKPGRDSIAVNEQMAAVRQQQF